MKALQLLGIALLVAVLAAPAVAFSMDSGSKWYRRTDEPGGDYFTGYLRVQSGKGGIAWRDDLPSEDPAVPGSPAGGTGLAGRVNSWAVDRTNTAIRVDEFVSDPLPMDLHLNASRRLQLDLQITDREEGRDSYQDVCYNYYIKLASTSFGIGSGDPDLRIEILANGELIAGAAFDPVPHYSYAPDRNKEPANYATCFYRMPLETNFLAKDTVITVRILVVVEGSPFKWGLAGNHRSVIRFPVFSEFEWLFRDPDAKRTSVGGAVETEDDSASGLLVVPVGLGLALALPRRRGPVLLALLVLGAGCFGGTPSGAPSGSATGGVSYSITPGSGDGGNGGNGSIAGVVHDDLYIPVSGVHVSLLRTSLFSRSDQHGYFRLSNLEPGTYTVRFDRKEFISIQHDVVVQENATTVLEVTLLPESQKDAGFRPHDHDYWSSETSKLVFEGALGFKCTGRAGNDCQPITTFSLPEGAPGEFNTIRPGTDRVDVTISWPSSMGVGRVGLAVQSNADHNPQNATHFYPRESGKTVRVATAWEMTDVGHARFSSWVFSLYRDPADERALLEAYKTASDTVEGLAGQSFHAKVVIHRGALPLERPHPDHWQGANRLGLGERKDLVLVPSQAPPDASAPPRALFVTASRVVPFDTKWMEVNITFDRATSPAWKPVLHYRPGGHKPVPNEDIRSTEFRKARVEPVQTGNLFQWRFELLDDEADAAYDVKTSWILALTPNDPQAHWADHWTHFPGSVRIGVSATAHHSNWTA